MFMFSSNTAIKLHLVSSKLKHLRRRLSCNCVLLADIGHIMDISCIRKPYNKPTDVLNDSEIGQKHPLEVFEDWMELAVSSPAVEEPTAMTLATVKKNGRPSARMVLLKGFGMDGFRFYTNSRSEKGMNLSVNPYAALVFYWEKLNRQVRIEGDVKMLPADSTDDYFHKRPKGSQLGALVSSHQSSPVPNREFLMDRYNKLDKTYCDSVIPRPDYWNGYLVKPERIEFWQGQSTRLHDRIVFSCDQLDTEGSDWLESKDGWKYQRLQP